MTAFPFGKNPPSLEDFIEKATNQFGAKLVVLDAIVRSEYGEVRPRVLERSVDGHDYHVTLPTFPEDCLLTGHTVRHLCSRLNIPTTAFDFELTDNGLTPLDRGDLN